MELGIVDQNSATDGDEKSGKDLVGGDSADFEIEADGGETDE